MVQPFFLIPRALLTCSWILCPLWAPIHKQHQVSNPSQMGFCPIWTAFGPSHPATAPTASLIFNILALRQCPEARQEPLDHSHSTADQP